MSRFLFSAQRFPIAAIAVLMLALSLGGCKKADHADAATGPAPASVDQQRPAPLPQASANTSGNVQMQLPDFTSLVDQYGPAVVNVSVVERAAKQPTTRSFQGGGGEEDDDPLQDFFRRFGIPVPRGNQRTPSQPQRGLGSGFIVSADGYILTNAHVVADASEVTVKLTDRREYPAKVVGFDKRTDVAVIKIDGKNLPIVKLGDAYTLRPGEWVVAIGAPFGFENSVTAGIVSATARSLDEGYVQFIQTDVPVNPGNSGGPLFNLRGEVVGINSQIYSQTGGYMGLSFAIPIQLAKNVEEQLVKTGHVQRGRIGVAIQDVNARLAESFGLDRPRGALVSSVEKNAPADKGGVKPGDVIIKVNGKDVERSAELPAVISMMKPGSEVTLTLWRDRQGKDVTVTIAELKEEQTKTSGKSGDEDESGRLGLDVRPLTPQEQSEAQTTGKLGVINATGPSADAGIQPGDVILQVNGAKVTTVQQLREQVKKAGKVVALLIQREDAQIYIPVPLE
jgi:serine protease Do